MSKTAYQVIVIGGGHAGAEAAWTAANMLFPQDQRVALITMNRQKIAQMSCNPAIGGLAKGQIVKEIDAMGGIMGLAIDATGIQFRVLNQSKGPAVRGPRAQADKYAYANEIQRLLETRPNLDIIESTVDQILIENGRCVGVQLTSTNINSKKTTTKTLTASTVILTTGTFMRGLMHTGDVKTQGGRVDENAAVGISANLEKLGFELGRLKTGTPPRLAAESIDFTQLQEQQGDTPPQPFSEMTHKVHPDQINTTELPKQYTKIAERFPVIEQRCCYLTETNQKFHDVIKANLDRAPMYNGQIEADSGPRYCPSIEDKVVRFADKSSHHVFLEPESLSTNEIYCNGISTSLPADVQKTMVNLMPGCENAKIIQYGYAVEYDMVWPHQIDATCMTKRITGLFFAGQINGTSGYEEAAGQGLLAGVNAVLYGRGESLVRHQRDQSYIGVMMDDLVTKTPREPYRMFTSRAEHRLILRADNAVDRLTPWARQFNLIDDLRWDAYSNRKEALQTLTEYCKSHSTEGVKLLQWMKRPNVTEHDVLAKLDGELVSHDLMLIAALLAEVKYEGFIQRHRRQHERLVKMESRPLPTDTDYTQIHGLRNEAKYVLNKFRPTTFGQASRLAGITPADLTVLALSGGRVR